MTSVNLDLSQIPHGFSPQFLKAFCQAICQLAVSDQQRRETAFLHERMIQGDTTVSSSTT
jgi:hypothetical protein